MKKLFVLLFTLSTAAMTMAYDFQSKMADGRVLYFNIVNNTECEVSRMYYTERNASYVSGSLIVPTNVSDPEGKHYTVVGIGKSAFVHCRSLTAITIPVTVTYIGNAAFQKCKGLTTINLPETIQTIGDEAFEGCTSLTELTLPRSLKSIGIEAFQECEALKTLHVGSLEPPTVTSSTFPLNDSERVPFTLIVPYGTFSTYRNTTYWNAFSEIREAGGYGQPYSAQQNAYPQQNGYPQPSYNGQQSQPYAQQYNAQPGYAQPYNAQPAGYVQQNYAQPYTGAQGYNNQGYAQPQGYNNQNVAQQGYANQATTQQGYTAQPYNAQGTPDDDASELTELQRQVIELQSKNSRLKDAIYRALNSSNFDECRRLLHEALSAQ